MGRGWRLPTHPHERSHLTRGLGLHPWQYMRVLLQGEARRMEPEPLGDHLDRNTGRDDNRGMGMPQIVEPDPGSRASSDNRTNVSLITCGLNGVPSSRLNTSP